MTSGYYYKKDDKKTKASYDWATTGIPVITVLLGSWATS